MPAVARDAFAHRALERAEAPAPDAVSASGVMLVDTMVPNGVSTARPPASGAPPSAVWQCTQLPSAASWRPRSITARCRPAALNLHRRDRGAPAERRGDDADGAAASAPAVAPDPCARPRRIARPRARTTRPAALRRAWRRRQRVHRRTHDLGRERRLRESARRWHRRSRWRSPPCPAPTTTRPRRAAARRGAASAAPRPPARRESSGSDSCPTPAP